MGIIFKCAKQKVLEEIPLYYIKHVLPFVISYMYEKFVHNIMESRKCKPKGFKKESITKNKNPCNIYLRILYKPVSRCGHLVLLTTLPKAKTRNLIP